MTDLVLCGTIWVFIVYAIQRGYRKRRHVDRFALLTWLIFIFIGLLFVFRSRVIEAWINQRCDDLPAAYWLNSLCTLAAATLYSLSFGWFNTPVYPRQRWHPWLVGGAPAAMVGVSLVFAGSAAQVITRVRAQEIMRMVTECYVAILLVGMLIPINVWLLRRERVPPMRIKHGAVIAAFVIYVVGALVVVMSTLRVVFTGQPGDGPHAVPRVALGALCVVVMLIPHRWLVPTLLPVRLVHYRRVAALERRMADLIPMDCEPFRWRSVWQSRYIEMATYTAVINILDNYWRLDPEREPDSHLYWYIETLLLEHPDYDSLVSAIGRKMP